ncbi:preprotein translocase subunit YajC [Dactylosporangium roseum]|uniref:Preprotein translocase subunit YajC n=1 Tax=Dactylosporangium roseum TaxID=47989 RepID=A0ABY5YYX2_9ACTN|nr:preprotein translocase subunit YajC [Dactylosporangium roseum]UWZ34959.1 preprotein translocase subunit YajC [Dactylosporangium roseum]
MYYAAESSGGNGFFTLLIFAGFFVLIYFLMIRPQQRRRREVESMQSAMGIGDEVVTVGGLYGIVRGIEDDTILLEISPGVTARYARAAIGKVSKKADAGDAEATDGEASADPAKDAD